MPEVIFDQAIHGWKPVFLVGKTWGDSYMMGHKPVKKAIIHRAMPYIGE